MDDFKEWEEENAKKEINEKRLPNKKTKKK